MNNFCHTILRNKNLIYIIILAIILRFIFMTVVKPWDQQVIQESILIGDAKGYHDVALNLLKYRTYDSSMSQFRTPGYPFFLALIYYIAGVKPWIVIPVQMLLTICMIFLVYHIGKYVFNENIAVISAILFTINPLVIYYSTTILTETLFSFVFLLSILFLIKGVSEERISLLYVSGILLGTSALIRPITQFFPVITAIVIASWPKRRISFKIKGLLSLLIIFYITISPWLIRNYVKYNHFKLSSFQGFNLLFFNATAVERAKTGKPYREIRKEFSELATEKGVSNPGETFENFDTYNDIASDYLMNNLSYYIPLHLKGMLLVFLDVGVIGICKIFGLETKSLSVEFTASNRNIIQMVGAFLRIKPISEILFSIPFYLLLFVTYGFFFLGCYQIIINNRSEYLILVSLVVLYFTFLPGVIGQARYRIPIIPLYLLISSVGIHKILTYFRIMPESKNLTFSKQQIVRIEEG